MADTIWRTSASPTGRYSDASDDRLDGMYIFEDDATSHTGNLGAACWRPTRGCDPVRPPHRLRRPGAELVAGGSSL
jgi:hypothetical protein